ncbi:MAG: hypothetical protein ACR2KV_12300 [Solirubrobacteraceae bacterium]
MSRDPGFGWVERVILDLHIEACHFQTEKEPGRCLRYSIEVTGPRGDAVQAIS